MKNFKIIIDNFLGGLAKRYWKADYSTQGQTNEAGRLRNVDLGTPNGIQPG